MSATKFHSAAQHTEHKPLARPSQDNLRISIMFVTQLLVLFLAIIMLIGIIAYGVTMSRKAKSDSDKYFRSHYLVVLVITFAAGGIARTIPQSTGYEWLNGFVPIFGGLFLSLLGILFVWRNSQNKFDGLTRALFFLLGLFIMFLGLGSIYLGITQVWAAFL